ncbi:hypothetical protein ACFLTI_03765, partial [Bacteroidota bacterium]
GGYEIINNVKTISIKAVYPDHGAVPMEIDIKLPNLSINPRSNIVFDGSKICLLNGRDGISGPELAPEDEWKDGEVEIAYHFPAFFEYPAEYDGIEDVDGNQFYKLIVNLPLGAKMTYYINSETFLTSKVMFEFIMKGEKYKNWRDWTDYKEVDGLLHPHGFTYGSRTGRQKGNITSIKLNIPMDDHRFQIPDNI